MNTYSSTGGWVMVDLAKILLLAHIGGAFMLIAGGLGRQLTRSHAAKSDEIAAVRALTNLATRFDRVLVGPGSTVLAVGGTALAVIQGWPLFGFLQGAQANWLLVSIILVLAIVPLIIFVFLPHRRRVEAALDAASAQGRVTDDLRALLNDRTQRLAHRAEEVMTLAVIILMVLKPF